jgi:hypothetical protein
MTDEKVDCWCYLSILFVATPFFMPVQGDSVLIKGTHHLIVNSDGVSKTITFDVVV